MRPMTPVLLVAVIFLAGCGCEKESLSKRAGKGLGDGISDFVSGVGESVDENLIVELNGSEEMGELGFEATTSKLILLSENAEKVVTVYLVSKKEFSGALLAKAMNEKGREIGRSRVEVEFGADDAKYVDFTFPKQMDRALVEKYQIGLAK